MKSVGRTAGLTWVYVTAPDRVVARRIARALVAERLAACVNVLGAVESTYRWKGAVEQGREVALIAKTQQRRLAALTARVAELHPYEVPCVVALPIRGGNRAFLSWVRAET